MSNSGRSSSNSSHTAGGSNSAMSIVGELMREGFAVSNTSSNSTNSLTTNNTASKLAHSNPNVASVAPGAVATLANSITPSDADADALSTITSADPAANDDKHSACYDKGSDGDNIKSSVTVTANTSQVPALIYNADSRDITSSTPITTATATTQTTTTGTDAPVGSIGILNSDSNVNASPIAGVNASVGASDKDDVTTLSALARLRARIKTRMQQKEAQPHSKDAPPQASTETQSQTQTLPQQQLQQLQLPPSTQSPPLQLQQQSQTPRRFLPLRVLTQRNTNTISNNGNSNSTTRRAPISLYNATTATISVVPMQVNAVHGRDWNAGIVDIVRGFNDDLPIVAQF